MEKHIFEINTDTFEIDFRGGAKTIPAYTAEEIFDEYMQGAANSPTIEATFDTLDEAKAEFARAYADYGITRVERTYLGYALTGRVAWIEESTVNEDGDYIDLVATYDVSAEGYRTSFRVSSRTYLGNAEIYIEDADTEERVETVYLDTGLDDLSPWWDDITEAEWLAMTEADVDREANERAAEFADAVLREDVEGDYPEDIRQEIRDTADRIVNPHFGDCMRGIWLTKREEATR